MKQGSDYARYKMAVVVSSDMTIKAFLLLHLRKLHVQCQLEVFANTQDTALLEREGVDASLRTARIVRPVSPLADMAALWNLFSCFLRGRYKGVLSITPKAGLLAMAASFMARVPVRVHIFTGQVWATRSGAARILFKSIDRITAMLATHVLVDGEPQRQFLIKEGVLRAGKSRVLGSGSLSGVDGLRFRPDTAARKSVREELGIADDDIVLLYVGRLNRDKGVLDLAQAFSRLAAVSPTVHLVMVGPDEAGIAPAVKAACSACARRLHLVDYTQTPERYMAAAEVFCLPSYREGFPTSILEAAACGIPAVASRIYGMADAVLEGHTGLVHAPGNVDELFNCLSVMVNTPAQRARLGSEARQRALKDFSSEQVSDNLVAYLQARLEEA